MPQTQVHHTVTLSRHRVNQSWVNPLNVERLARKQPAPILTPLVWCGRGSNPQPPDYEVNALSTRWREESEATVSYNYWTIPVHTTLECMWLWLYVWYLQGVQAQTVANFFLAFDLNLTIIPVLNKIDLPNAYPEAVIQQLHNVFGLEPSSILKVR